MFRAPFRGTPRKCEEMCAWRVSTTQSSWKIRDARMSSDPSTTTIEQQLSLLRLLLVATTARAFTY